MTYLRPSSVSRTLPPRGGKRGVALLLVLAAIALIALLVSAVLLSVSFESATSSSAESNSQTQNLAADVTQLVISQIRDGASGGQTIGWASQPGMIRTFDNAAGNPLNCYKLYSSDQMVVNGAHYTSDLKAGTTGLSTTDIPAAGWDTASAGIYTDLNAPVQDAAGTLNYPILDPHGLSTYAGAVTPYVQGFAVQTPPLGQSSTAPQNPVPMPVKWLYVRQNGYITAASSPSGGTVTVPQDPSYAPTTQNPTNPLVGRIAFWADDETCKVNVNTAGEGLFWDTPRAASNVTGPATSSPADTANPMNENNEYYYSLYQPALHEFQRYPGHPAGVALSPILGPNFNTLFNGSSAFTPAPRLVPSAGSAAGTVNYMNATPVTYSNATRKSLYASVDEYFFRDNTTTLPRTPTDPNYSSASATINKARLEAAKFFLTAHSSAPEVNLFNLPRIASWPIDQDVTANPTSSAFGSGYDKLIAYCSSLFVNSTPAARGTAMPYYFQRSAGNDGSETDYDASIARNQTLYHYLQYLTGQPEPGFGGNSLAQKYPVDNNQILTEIEDYIRCADLNDLNLPSANRFAPSQWVKPLYNSTNNTMGFGRSFTVREVALEVICCADAQIAPGGAVATGSTATANPNGWDGNNAANPMLAGINPDVTGYPSATIAKTSKPLAAYEKRYQAAIFFQVQCTSPGNGYPGEDLLVQMTGQGGITFPGAVDGPFPHTVTDTNPFYDSSTYAMKITNVGGNGAGFQVPGEVTEARTLFRVANLGMIPQLTSYPYPSSPPAPASNSVYCFVSKPFTIPAVPAGTPLGSTYGAASSISVSGAPLTISIYQAHGHSVTDASAGMTSGNLIQTIKVKFPSTVIPAPTLDVSAGGPSDNSPSYALNWSFNRLQKAAIYAISGYAPGADTRDTLYNPNDVVRGISIAHGDTRLIAATRTLNDTTGTVFVPRTDSPWTYTATNHFSTFFEPGGLFGSSVLPGTSSWTPIGMWPSGYVINPNLPAVPPFMTDVPVAYPPLTGTVRQDPYVSRDWDSPLGNYQYQGAFINKPDEGDTTPPTAGAYYPYFDASSGTDAGTNQANFYTPNRIMPSPGMFGSLPTGVVSQKPWQTLLFRPYVNHPQSAYNFDGSRSTTAWPPDHLYMDLFWMPQVEPYAVSNSFSTAGQINMNYQIVPFTYITRNTALKCLIQGGVSTAANSNGLYTGEKLFSVPNAYTNPLSPTYYKSIPNAITGVTQPLNGAIPSFRSAIDCGTLSATSAGADPVGETARTFRQFKQRFNSGDIFRSPSEICDIYLTPLGQTFSNAGTYWPASPQAETYWSAHLGTADNDRERPYADLYRKLTTKSNTFLVHLRVQSIKQAPSEIASHPTQWSENSDVVTGEYRGSALIERYIDATDPRMQDYATTALTGSGTLDDLYKFRIVYNKQFAP